MSGDTLLAVVNESHPEYSAWMDDEDGRLCPMVKWHVALFASTQENILELEDWKEPKDADHMEQFSRVITELESRGVA